MPLLKFSEKQKGEFKSFLGLNWSFSEIIKHFKARKVYVSKAYLSKLKNKKENSENTCPNSNRGRKPKLSKSQLKWLTNETLIPNPISQAAMAKKLKMTRQSVAYNIRVKLNRKLVKKPRSHLLTDSMISKRHSRSWSLYNKLKCDKYKNYISSDEAMFKLNNVGGQTNLQYVTIGEKAKEVLPRENRQFSKSVMVWAAISCNGRSKLRFVEPGVKIDKKYYVKKILRPFLRYDIPKMYPNRNFVFQQDSAPSHRAEFTQNYLKEKKVMFLTPEQWLPNSPDCSPCDYFLWGYLKNRLKNYKLNTIDELKKALNREYQKVPQEMIDNAMRAWPKRCRRIYYARGRHIEKTSFYYRQK